MLTRLFVYGTLHPDRVPAEIAPVVRQFVSLGRGTVRGELRQLAEYPALRLDDEASDVPGEVFCVAQECDWIALDAYEGFAPGDAANSLFVREVATVRMDNGAELECWIYSFARELPGKLYSGLH